MDGFCGALGGSESFRVRCGVKAGVSAGLREGAGEGLALGDAEHCWICCGVEAGAERSCCSTAAGEGDEKDDEASGAENDTRRRFAESACIHCCRRAVATAVGLAEV